MDFEHSHFQFHKSSTMIKHQQERKAHLVKDYRSPCKTQDTWNSQVVPLTSGPHPGIRNKLPTL